MRLLPLLAVLACGCEFDVPGVGTGPATDLDVDLASATDDGGTDAQPFAGPDLADIDASGGLLSVTRAAAPTMADLTALGTIDWAHWGHESSSDFDHKMGVGILPDRKMINSAGPSQYGDNLTGFTWTDGDPHATATNTTTGVYNFGIGTGFELDVPADPTTRTLWLFVGGHHAEGTLDVSLSDGSAPTRTDKQSSSGGDFYELYRIDFHAATPSQTLVLRWTESWDYFGGNVTLQAAALTN